MNSLVVSFFGLLCLMLGYIFYAAFIEKKIWQVDYTKPTPAVTNYDGLDYVPAKHWIILFGHHFSSIAGAAPIVGPVIACALFGWGPALLWVIFGSIFIGGVHDFSSLMLSVRHGGATVGCVAETILGRHSSLIFSIFLLLSLVLVIAVFATVTAQTLVSEPKIVIPTFGLILIAVIFGIAVYKNNAPNLISTIIAIVVTTFLIYLGWLFPIQLNFTQSLNFWIIILLIYSFIASITPVNVLLQPRDYLSAFILFFGLALGYLGIFISHPDMQTPIVTTVKSTEGPIWPMLFVIIACGAISGFHSLISSGTTSRQLPQKRWAKRITYGAMLLEGALSVLAIIAVCAGLHWLGGKEGLIYPEIVSKKGPIVAFSIGFGHLVAPVVGVSFGSLIAMLTLNSFVMTTLDTATRIARYVTQELAGTLKIKPLTNKYTSTGVIVFLALFLAFGSWKAVWPVFGASNQLIAAMVLLIVSVYLFQKGKLFAFTFIPAIFMITTTVAALCYSVVIYFLQKKYLLVGITVILLVLAVDILVEAVRVILRRIQDP